MASFNGIDLGLVFEMSVGANPKGRQINTYPGANGLEVIDHGTRGGRTVCLGALGGATTAVLASAEAALRGAQLDGGKYTLVDTLGISWTGVILANFQPVGRVNLLAGGGYGRKYQAEFLHVD